MTRPSAVVRAIRDSMLVGWLLLGTLALAVVFSIRDGITWWTAVPVLLAVPLVVHLWARALCHLESGLSGIEPPTSCMPHKRTPS